MDKIINIAVVAHVDAGKSTLVDALLKQNGAFKAHEDVGELIMDSDSIEKERGITIYSKNCSIHYKDLVLTCMAEVESYDSYYETLFGDVTFEVIKNVNRTNIIQAVTAKDGENILGYAYIVRVENEYGYNIMCVGLDKDGKFKDVLDVENNHSNVDDWTSSNPNVFVSGMTSEQIDNIKYDAVSGASYTIETIKLAIMIAMNECGETNNSAYEAAARKIFPGMVAGRSEILTNVSEDIDFGYRVVGATGPFDGNSTSNLGYFFVVSGEHKRGDLTLGIGIDNEGKLVGINIIENGQTASWPQKIADYVASFTAGMTASDVANKETVAGATLGTQLVKDLLAKAFNAYETLKGGNN